MSDSTDSRLARLTGGLSLDLPFFLIARWVEWPSSLGPGLGQELQLGCALLRGLELEERAVRVQLTSAQQTAYTQEKEQIRAALSHELEDLRPILARLNQAHDSGAIVADADRLGDAIEAAEANMACLAKIVKNDAGMSQRAMDKYWIDRSAGSVLESVQLLASDARRYCRFEVALDRLRTRAEHALELARARARSGLGISIDRRQMSVDYYAVWACLRWLNSARPCCEELALNVHDVGSSSTTRVSGDDTSKRAFDTCLTVFEGMMVECQGLGKDLARQHAIGANELEFAESTHGFLSECRRDRDGLMRDLDRIGHPTPELAEQLGELIERLSLRVRDMLARNADGDESTAVLLHLRRNSLVNLLRNYDDRIRAHRHPPRTRARDILHQARILDRVSAMMSETLDRPTHVTDEYRQRVVPLSELKRQIRQLEVLLATVDGVRFELTGRRTSNWNETARPVRP